VVAPSSFVDLTAKYWIEALLTASMTAVAEVPLLVYGSNGRLTNQTDSMECSPKDELWDTLATTIIYSTRKSALYQERIARTVAVQPRVSVGNGSIPAVTEPVFLELKTHHENGNQH
jgi:SPX domain protein involved in polyphosphate accumulation